MKIKNRLKELLLEFGIKTMTPTKRLLEERLGGMTPHRFNQILNNHSKTELSVLEVSQLTKWLSELTNKSEASINLLEQEQEATKQGVAS